MKDDHRWVRIYLHSFGRDKKRERTIKRYLWFHSFFLCVHCWIFARASKRFLNSKSSEWFSMDLVRASNTALRKIILIVIKLVGGSFIAQPNGHAEMPEGNTLKEYEGDYKIWTMMLRWRNKKLDCEQWPYNIRAIDGIGNEA